MKRSLARDYRPLGLEGGILEFIPETWDPEKAEDVSFLSRLDEELTLLPHCVSLNVLGDGPSERSLKRVRAWIQRLHLGWVGDHYSWSNAGELSSRLAIPSFDGPQLCIERVKALQDRLGCQLILENIATPFDERRHLEEYHDSLAQCLGETSCRLLLDLENIRIDAVNGGMNPRELLARYRGADVAYIHVAGGSFNGILETDSHTYPCRDATVDLLEEVIGTTDVSVIYERDYDIDVKSIAEEIARLRGRVDVP